MYVYILGRWGVWTDRWMDEVDVVVQRVMCYGTEKKLSKQMGLEYWGKGKRYLNEVASHWEGEI